MQHLVPAKWVEQRHDWSAVVHRSAWELPSGPALAAEFSTAQPHGVLERGIKLVDTRVHCKRQNCNTSAGERTGSQSMRILTPGCPARAPARVEAGHREQICEVSRRQVGTCNCSGARMWVLRFYCPMWHLQVLQAGISAGVALSGLQPGAIASQSRLPPPTEAPFVQQGTVTASCAAVEGTAVASQPLAFAFFPQFDFDGAQAPVASLSQPQQVQEAYDSFAGWLWRWLDMTAGPARSSVLC